MAPDNLSLLTPRNAHSMSWRVAADEHRQPMQVSLHTERTPINRAFCAGVALFCPVGRLESVWLLMTRCMLSLYYLQHCSDSKGDVAV